MQLLRLLPILYLQLPSRDPRLPFVVPDFLVMQRELIPLARVKRSHLVGGSGLGRGLVRGGALFGVVVRRGVFARGEG